MDKSFSGLFNAVDAEMRRLGIITENNATGIMSIPHNQDKRIFDEIDDCYTRIFRCWDQTYLEIFVRGRLKSSDIYDYYEIGFYWIHKNDKETYKMLSDIGIEYVYLFDKIIMGKES